LAGDILEVLISSIFKPSGSLGGSENAAHHTSMIRAAEQPARIIFIEIFK